MTSVGGSDNLYVPYYIDLLLYIRQRTSIFIDIAMKLTSCSGSRYNVSLLMC